MKTLLILRHAKSSWKAAHLSDHERPLNKRGKHDAPRMGQLLLANDLLPQLIICSSAKRARETFRLLSKACDYQGEIHFSDTLYLAEPEAYIEALSKFGDGYERVMVIGHNPGLEELLEDLSTQQHRFPTAALAQISLPIKRWRELNASIKGNLIKLWLPRRLAE